MTPAFLRFAGWSSMAAAGFNVISYVALTVFFILIPTQGTGNFFGPLNDATAALGALAALAPAAALYQLHRARAARLSLAALLIALAGSLALAGMQSLVVANPAVFFPPSETVGPLSFGVTGLARLIFARLAGQQRTLSDRLAGLGLASGLVSLALVGIGFSLGWGSPVTSLAGLLYIVLGVGWDIGLGRALLARSRAAQPAALAA